MTFDEFRKATHEKCWKSLAHYLLQKPKPSSTTAEQFGTHWIESGHRIREQIADDQILVSLLRHMLLPYEGKAVTLFRGENLQRFENCQVGFAWTPSIEVARMFGKGLNSTPSGGVLLQGCFEPEAVICGPNIHSAYLGEDQYTVDPIFGKNFITVERYAPAY